jgi:hypothetical protein
MAYGFEVLIDAGKIRVYDGSVLFKYHSTHTVYVPPDVLTKRLYVSGFIPFVWGYHLLNVETSGSDAHLAMPWIAPGDGFLTFSGVYSESTTYIVNILKG